MTNLYPITLTTTVLSGAIQEWSSGWTQTWPQRVYSSRWPGTLFPTGSWYRIALALQTRPTSRYNSQCNVWACLFSIPHQVRCRLSIKRWEASAKPWSGHSERLDTAWRQSSGACERRIPSACSKSPWQRCSNALCWWWISGRASFQKVAKFGAASTRRFVTTDPLR